VFISNGYLTKRNEGGRKTKWVYGEEGRKTKWVYGEEGMGRDLFFFSSFNCRHGVGILRKKG
jgi:hypothetical protein